MEEQLKTKTEESIKKILDEGITTNNLEHLYKLAKINHIAKEDENMNYRGYGNYGYGAENYEGNYGRRYRGDESYGRRGVKGTGRSRYRGEDMLNEMYEEYGNYMEGDSYGGEETTKALKYMLKSAEDFFKHIQEEAKSPEEIEMVKESARKISMM